MKREQKQEELYRTALTIFAEYGYKKTTIEDIASAMGLAKGTLYLYAKNKLELYRDTVAWAFNRWQNRVKEAVIQVSDPVEKLMVLSHSAYEYLSGDRAFRKILERDPDLFPLFESKDPFSDINMESVSMIKAILIEGAESGVLHVPDPEQAARCLFSIYVMFIQKTYVVPEGEPVKSMFETAINLLLRGLRAH
ncbi:MAG TPA: TetR/AcrR family transcriptional regulator [Spirochaetota bacterium]|nr:TetR/AcrR family transcriptional regulator [Spirochaetota bacterium]HPJ38477.1 TetR/AcrR family transcriptional regulator [Spirochaetota bacterium]HPQ54317.1 TetR/AcrR family transcriptional regulator [Spirochaetota bacterium]